MQKGRKGREGGVCVSVCVCVCKCNVCECYSPVLVIRLTYTSTKACIKDEWHDYGEYIYPLSISKLREGYALSKCFSFIHVYACMNIQFNVMNGYSFLCRAKRGREREGESGGR